MHSSLPQMPLRLRDDPLSTDCYSVRLLLEFLALPYQLEYADIEHSGADFIAPALVATCYDTVGLMPVMQVLIEMTQTKSVWMPSHLEDKIQVWFDFNQSLTLSLGKVRQAHLFMDQFLADEPELIQQATQMLSALDDHLGEQIVLGQRYLVTEHATIADLVVFSQVALAFDAGLSLTPFLHIRRWINHIRQQPSFIAMPGLLALMSNSSG